MIQIPIEMVVHVHVLLHMRVDTFGEITPIFICIVTFVKVNLVDYRTIYATVCGTVNWVVVDTTIKELHRIGA